MTKEGSPPQEPLAKTTRICVFRWGKGCWFSIESNRIEDFFNRLFHGRDGKRRRRSKFNKQTGQPRQRGGRGKVL